MRSPFRIGEHSIEPGSRATLDLPLVRLYTHTQMDMPVSVIHGRKAGPVALVTAAVHGDEINGIEIIRRLLRRKELNRIRGTLVAIPVVNVFGFVSQSRYLPDRRDLNRYFPGTGKGSLTSGLASLLMEEIAQRADFCLDLHSGSQHRKNLPQARANFDDPAAHELVEQFSAPVLVHSIPREGSLRWAFQAMGKPALVFEGGEALRFDEPSIQAGLNGILNVLRHRGLLAGKPRLASPLMARSFSWVRSPISGIHISRVPLGHAIQKGQVLGTVADPFGDNEQPVLAHHSGLIIGAQQSPLVYRGDALFNIANLDATDEVDDALAEFHRELALDFDHDQY